MSNPYPIPQYIYDTLVVHPDWSGKKLADELGLKGRTARRYVKKFKDNDSAPCPAKYSYTATQDLKLEIKDYIPRVELNAAVFDIETTSFTATGYDGILVCCSFFPLRDEKPYTVSLKFGDKNDKRVLEETIHELNKYDFLIGHYISGYDLPWLATRADIYHLPALRRWFLFDTYYMAKAQRLKTERKSLAFLVDHFNIEGTKTSILPRAWHNIRSQVEEEFETAKKNIVTHCEFDVEANRNLFDRLYPRSLVLAQSPVKMTFWGGAK